MEWTDRVVQGYVRRFARNNAWHFIGVLDEPDLIQEFALVFIDVKNRQGLEHTARQFMEFFKRALRWRLIDLIREHVGTRHSAETMQASAAESRARSGNTSHANDVSALDSYQRGVLRKVDGGFDDVDTRLDFAAVMKEAPEPVRRYVHARASGTFKRRGETVIQAIPRVTGMPRSSFYKMLQTWGQREGGLALAIANA